VTDTFYYSYERNLSSISSHHTIYPIRGGGDYRGIYDTGFKRGFMGYIGLLFNAPYKIDSMVGMKMWMYLLVTLLDYFVFLFLLG
jgi:hypothetical protein